MKSSEENFGALPQAANCARTRTAVVEELIVSLEREGLESLHDPTPFSPDPPDVICLDSNDRRVAVEVVEAVSQEAVAANARGNKVVKWWEPQEFAFHVAGLVLAKDAKVFAGGPFERIIVCVHTDELVVTPEEHGLTVSSMPPIRLNQVTAAYILFSYAPGSQSYPVRRIPVAT